MFFKLLLVCRNEFDLEEARILRNKTKKRYESYLAELEAAEIKKVATLEGIVRAKALSVAVRLYVVNSKLRFCLVEDSINIATWQVWTYQLSSVRYNL